MAFILLVDSSDMARKALRGILARGNHRLAFAATEQEAWDFITRVVKVDLVITEAKLDDGTGPGLLQRLKGDPFLNLLPVLIYTDHGDRDTVKRALELHAQNILIKPYCDSHLFTEIKKATLDPWRAKQFEEEGSFCKMMGITPAALHRDLDRLRQEVEATAMQLRGNLPDRASTPAGNRLKALAENAEGLGAWGVVECANRLASLVEAGAWTELEQAIDQLGFASRLILQHLNSNLMPPEYLTDHEVNSQQEDKARARWAEAVAALRFPVVEWSAIQRELEALPGCPVIDSAAAAFQMTATGRASSLNPLMDLVERDVGLSAQLLITANHLNRNEDADFNPIEDPRLAVGRLGEVRLAAQATSLVVAEGRLLQASTHFDWARFWMFQTGVSRMARFTCHYLELYSMEGVAATAGMLHNLGLLLLLRLHPFGLQAIHEHVRQHNVPLRAAERLLLGCTTSEMATHFAEKQGLPRRFTNVLRWIDAPADATEDAELVAVISFARDLCRQNHVGTDGETSRQQARPIEESPEWEILKRCVYPSFNLKKFEHQVQADCRELKLELYGRIAAHAAA